MFFVLFFKNGSRNNLHKYMDVRTVSHENKRVVRVDLISSLFASASKVVIIRLFKCVHMSDNQQCSNCLVVR